MWLISRALQRNKQSQCCLQLLLCKLLHGSIFLPVLIFTVSFSFISTNFFGLWFSLSERWGLGSRILAMSWSALLGFSLWGLKKLISCSGEPYITDNLICAACLWQNDRCHLSLGLAEAVGRGIEFFFWKASVSTGCQIIKKGAFQGKLRVMCFHLLSAEAERMENIKRGGERRRGVSSRGVQSSGAATVAGLGAALASAC